MQPIVTRPRAPRSRLLWALSGVAVIAAIALPASWGLIRAGNVEDYGEPTAALPLRTLTIGRSVTALSLESYGAPIKVTGQPGSQVTVTEAIVFDRPGPPPLVTDKVSRGLLTLAAPACQQWSCSVGFTVTVPSGVTVSASSDGGPVAIAGTGAAVLDSGGGPVSADDIRGSLKIAADGGSVAAVGVTGNANLDSGGGPVSAADISGPLTVTPRGGDVTVSRANGADINSGGGEVNATIISRALTVRAEGGGVGVDDVTGNLNVDTGGGPLTATGIAAATATALTEGGGATLEFVTEPTTVLVRTGGGGATLAVPGGPYALNASTGGAPQSVTIVTSPSASRSITVSTEEGVLQIGPA